MRTRRDQVGRLGAIIADDGTVTGERPVMRVTPSRLLTREQAALVRTVTTKGGGLRFETHDKRGALAHLARILGLVQAPDAATSTTIHNTQVNVGPPACPGLAFVAEDAFLIG